MKNRYKISPTSASTRKMAADHGSCEKQAPRHLAISGHDWRWVEIERRDLSPPQSNMKKIENKDNDHE